MTDGRPDVVRTFVAGYAIVIGILLVPPVVNARFAMLRLLDREGPWLWAASAGVILAGLYCRYGRWRPRPVTLILFGVLLVITLELGVRLAIRHFAPQSQLELSRWGNMSYDDLLAYQGHPFVQFTGKPSAALIGNRALGALSPWNNFGFRGRDFRHDKPPGTIRIAALGGSTTVDGYPELVESILNRAVGDGPARFEVLNFGMAFWTSAHSLVNFVLNALDFRPDYVVVHDGWNDAKARLAGPDFRGDYSHALKVFEPPAFVPDRYLLRTSVIYRAIKRRWGPPDWAFLDRALEVPRRRTGGYENVHELDPFRRNVETIIRLAASHDLAVVLLTIPHSTDPGKPHYSDVEHLEQCNAILRELARRHAPRTVVVDLDRMMTGKMESVFTDLGHVDAAGRAFKADQVARAIQAHWRASGSPGR